MHSNLQNVVMFNSIHCRSCVAFCSLRHHWNIQVNFCVQTNKKILLMCLPGQMCNAYYLIPCLLILLIKFIISVCRQNEGEEHAWLDRQTHTHTFLLVYYHQRHLFPYFLYILSSYINVCSVGTINVFNFLIQIVQSYSWLTLMAKLTAIIIRKYKVYFHEQLQKCSHEGWVGE